MNIKTYKILTIFLLLVAFTNCSEENIEDNNLTSTNDSSLSASCDSCSNSPGDNSNFRSALQKMDLEFNTNGGSSKKTVSKPENDSACNVDYFTSCGSWMVLKSESKESDRTELKLPTNLSLNNYAKMEFRAIVENIPTSNDNDKRGITVAQIHNRYDDSDGPLVKVYVTKHTNKMRIVVNDDYKDASTKHSDLIDFEDGEEFLLRMEILSSKEQVKIYAKNMSTNKQKTITINVDDNWDKADDYFYFKTGLYNQASGKEARMSYRYLTLDSI